MNVLFINDSASNPNWGDRAAAISLQSMIFSVGGGIAFALTEEALAHTLLGEGPPVVTSLSPYRTSDVVKQFVPPVLIRMGCRLVPGVDNSRTGRLIPRNWEDFAEAARAVGKRNPWPRLTQAIDESDLMVIHGDGAMVGNGIIPRTMLFLTYLVKKYYEKPVIMVNHTADLDHPDLRKMACEVYPLFDDVVFRDPISAERCKRYVQWQIRARHSIPVRTRVARHVDIRCPTSYLSMSRRAAKIRSV